MHDVGAIIGSIFVGAITGSLFVSISSINQFTSFYGFICLILCAVHTKWICTRPHVSTQGYLFVSFIAILLAYCQGPFRYLQTYLSSSLSADMT